MAESHRVYNAALRGRASELQQLLEEGTPDWGTGFTAIHAAARCALPAAKVATRWRSGPAS